MDMKPKRLLAGSGLLLALITASGIAIAAKGDGVSERGPAGSSELMLERGGHRGDALRHNRGAWNNDGQRRGHQRFGRRGQGREITQAQAQAKARMRFARFDTNSDGLLEMGEITTRLEARAERRRHRRMSRRGHTPAKRWQRRLARMDADRDGKISQAEFAKLARTRFKRRDLNNDGKITDADLPPALRDRDLIGGDGTFNRAFMTAGKRAGGQRGFRRGRGMMKKMRLVKWLGKADANRDGAVTMDEAMQLAGKRFARADKTDDGVLDRSDRTARQQERLTYRAQRFVHRFGAQADRAGQVTRAQFLNTAQTRFARRDLNNDGRISRDERGGHRNWRGRRDRHWR